MDECKPKSQPLLSYQKQKEKLWKNVSAWLFKLVLPLNKLISKTTINASLLGTHSMLKEGGGKGCSLVWPIWVCAGE